MLGYSIFWELLWWTALRSQLLEDQLWSLSIILQTCLLQEEKLPNCIVMHCVICYRLYNLKNMKNTHGGVLLLVLKAGINLDKNIVQLSDPAPLYKNYTNLDFNAKHLKRGWKREVVNFVVPFFFKESALFGKYRMLPWYFWLDPEK